MKRTNSVTDALNTNKALIDVGDGIVIPLPVDGVFGGAQGAPGVGVPEGGTSGQVVQRTAGGTIWATPSKDLVGLSSVDNTADLEKPLSEPQALALTNKADLIGGKVPASQLPPGALVADETVAQVINEPVTGAAIDARINTQVAPQVQQITADYIAGDRTVADAAAAAVNVAPKIVQLETVTIPKALSDAKAYADTVASGATASNLAFSLVQNPQPTSVTLSTVRGTPVYGAPAKFGTAQSGGVTKATGVVPDSPALTFDGWFMQPALPAGTALDIIWSVNGFLYVCIEPTTGFLSYVHSGSIKRTAQINVCDGAWHHVAVELTRSGTTVTLTGMWLDGKPVTGAAVSGGVSTWNADLTLGGNPGAGFDLAGSIDSVRISNQAIFPAPGFVPPNWHNAPSYYASFIAHMDSNLATKYAYAYPARPANAPGGSVTYTGSSQPTDWLTNDRWVKV